VIAGAEGSTTARDAKGWKLHPSPNSRWTATGPSAFVVARGQEAVLGRVSLHGTLCRHRVTLHATCWDDETGNSPGPSSRADHRIASFPALTHSVRGVQMPVEEGDRQ
jgi:hypothetical protein